MTWQNRIAHLEEAHASLNKQIDHAEKSGVYEDEHLHEMKKKRLHLKDEIAKLKSLHANEK